MFEYLTKEAFPKYYEHHNQGNKKELQILELGSGTGILGLCLSVNGSNVVLTDPGIDVNLSEGKSSNTINLLRSNVEVNQAEVEGRYQMF